MKKNNLIFVLHAHLPFVRHPEYSRFLEEDWLFEAISETYLPLLRSFRKLKADKIPFSLTISISPTLAAMLSDPLLQDRYLAYSDRLLELAEKEILRTKDSPDFHALALLYQNLFEENKKDFLNLYNKNILTGFKDLEKSGHLELITTSATHAFLPCYQEFPSSVRAQVQIAMDSHLHHFGKLPNGFWLPECGFFPGLEEVLQENDLKYFFSSAHGVLFSHTKPTHSIYKPVSCKNGTVVFPRDIASSKQVWSPVDGYPGDEDYRDFYRDIGFDLPLDYIAPYIHDNKIRVNTGFKYYRITGKETNDKQVYNYQKAMQKVENHVDNFIYNRKKQFANVSGKSGCNMVVSPFDAELFGHWWFEGPKWLELLIRKVAVDDQLQMVSASRYLSSEKKLQVVDPVYSSWGNNGFGEVWIDGSNDWIYPLIHGAIEKMEDLVARFPNESSLKERILNQAAREILLAQASDWPFIMYMGTTVGYATKRIKDHIGNFNRIYNNLCRSEMNTDWITTMEKKNNLFPFVDYRIFSKNRGFSV